MLAVCAAGHTSNVQFVHSHHWSLFMGCWTKERHETVCWFAVHLSLKC